MSEREYICIKHDSAACSDCVNDMRVLESALRTRIERLKGALMAIKASMDLYTIKEVAKAHLAEDAGG